MPPWVKYAAPPAARAIRAGAGHVVVTQIPPRRIILVESTIESSTPSTSIDKCPDQPVDGRDDEDGCPEPTHNGPPEIIEIE